MVPWSFAQAASFAPPHIRSTSKTTCVVSVTSRREGFPQFGIRVVLKLTRAKFRIKIGDVSGRRRRAVNVSPKGPSPARARLTNDQVPAFRVVRTCREYDNQGSTFSAM